MLPSPISRRVGVLFLSSNNWASAILRGTMMSHLIEEQSRQASLPLHSTEFQLLARGTQFEPQLKKLRDTIISGDFNICLLVKFSELSQAQITKIIHTCHSARAIVIWDIIDHPQILAKPAQYLAAIPPKPDYWIVTNSGAAKMLASLGIDRSKIWLIPHQHTNFASEIDFREACSTRTKKISEATSPIRVCTHGNTENQMSSQEYNDLSMKFKQITGRRYILDHIPVIEAGRNHTDLWNQQRLHDSLSICDVAVIWNCSHADIRPNTRLATWWSHGIPTVFHSDYSAYSDLCQFTTNPPLCLEFGVQTFDQVVSTVQRLSSQPALYHEHCEMILQASQQLSPRSIAEKYLNQFLQLKTKNKKSFRVA